MPDQAPALFPDPATLAPGWQRDLAELWPMMLAVYGTDPGSLFAARLLHTALVLVHRDRLVAEPDGVPELNEAQAARAETDLFTAMLAFHEHGGRQNYLRQLALSAAVNTRRLELRERAGATG